MLLERITEQFSFPGVCKRICKNNKQTTKVFKHHDFLDFLSRHLTPKRTSKYLMEASIVLDDEPALLVVNKALQYRWGKVWARMVWKHQKTNWSYHLVNKKSRLEKWLKIENLELVGAGLKVCLIDFNSWRHFSAIKRLQYQNKLDS